MSNEGVQSVELSREVIDHIRGLVNAAADEVVNFADLPDSGARDAINLMVNLVVSWVEDDPHADVETIIESCYEGDEESDLTLVQQVRSWIEGA